MTCGLRAAWRDGCSSLQPGAPSVATAKITRALILALMRNLPQQVASLRAGQWQCGVGLDPARPQPRHPRLRPARREVARLGQAFGMRVVVGASEALCVRAGAEGWMVADSRAALYSAGSGARSLHLAGPTRAPTSFRCRLSTSLPA